MGLFLGGGSYYWRPICATKRVLLIFAMDFVSENAVPEGMWVQLYQVEELNFFAFI